MIPAIALVSGLVQLAPALTKFFGAGDVTTTVAEEAASLARKLTGTQSNDAALEAIKSDPKLLIEYQQLILANETSFEQLYQQDKESARNRDVEFLKAGTRNYRADFLVGVSVLIVFTILGVVIVADTLNEYAKGALTTILGVFLNQLTNVFSFEFGTTRKDEEKQSRILSEYIKG